MSTKMHFFKHESDYVYAHEEYKIYDNSENTHITQNGGWLKQK